VTGRVVHVDRGRLNFVEPDGVASNGRDVWVVGSETGNNVVERSAVTGQRLRTFAPTHLETSPGQSLTYAVDLSPTCVSVDGNFVWTGNEEGLTQKPLGGSVTQIDAATDRVVRTVGGTADRFWGTIQNIDSDGTHVWVVNGSVSYRGRRRGDTVTELNATNGSLVRVIQLHDGIYADPVGVVSNGVDVWVTDSGGGFDGVGSVLEFDVATGKLVRDIGG